MHKMAHRPSVLSTGPALGKKQSSNACSPSKSNLECKSLNSCGQPDRRRSA